MRVKKMHRQCANRDKNGFDILTFCAAPGCSAGCKMSLGSLDPGAEGTIVPQAAQLTACTDYLPARDLSDLRVGSRLFLVPSSAKQLLVLFSLEIVKTAGGKGIFCVLLSKLAQHRKFVPHATLRLAFQKLSQFSTGIRGLAICSRECTLWISAGNSKCRNRRPCNFLGRTEGPRSGNCKKPSQNMISVQTCSKTS